MPLTRSEHWRDTAPFVVASTSVSQQSVWNTCILRSTILGADTGDVLAIQALSVESKLLYDQVECAENSVERLHTLTDALKHQAELIAAENAKLDILKRSLQHFDSSTS